MIFFSNALPPFTTDGGDDDGLGDCDDADGDDDEGCDGEV